MSRGGIHTQGQRAFYSGRENIMSAFETVRNGNPYYSVWYGRDIIFQFPESDMQKGATLLDQLLQAAENQDNTDILTIKFHPKPDKNSFITDKTPVIGTMPVRVVEFGTENDASVGGLDNRGMMATPVYHMMKNITDLLNESKQSNIMLEQRLLKLETEPEALLEPEKDLFDKISGIIEKPGMMDLIGKVIAMLPLGLPQQPNMMVSGVNETNDNLKINTSMADTAKKSDDGSVETESFPSPVLETINQLEYDSVSVSIDVLAKHCNIVQTLAALATFSEDNPGMFKTLLSNLIPV
jgi:hypothetical protein